MSKNRARPNEPHGAGKRWRGIRERQQTKGEPCAIPGKETQPREVVEPYRLVVGNQFGTPWVRVERVQTRTHNEDSVTEWRRPEQSRPVGNSRSTRQAAGDSVGNLAEVVDKWAFVFVAVVRGRVRMLACEASGKQGAAPDTTTGVVVAVRVAAAAVVDTVAVDRAPLV